MIGATSKGKPNLQYRGGGGGVMVPNIKLEFVF